MKLFSREKDWCPGYMTPNAIFAWTTNKLDGHMFSFRAPLPPWYDWELQDFGHHWSFGLKWFNFHVAFRKGEPLRHTAYCYVLFPSRIERICR